MIEEYRTSSSGHIVILKGRLKCSDSREEHKTN